MSKKLILGSSSPYRKTLLERLTIPFECHSPNIDESPQEQENAEELVKRLTIAKAYAVHNERRQKTNQNNDLIVTSDQVAVMDKQILGKPLTVKKAIQQLTAFSGKKVSFLTGLCIFNQEDESYQYSLSQYHVYFRELTDIEIENYVAIESPLDCAGSFKCEGLGVCLFDKMEGDDPNSLIGLPLITLSKLLREIGVNPINRSFD